MDDGCTMKVLGVYPFYRKPSIILRIYSQILMINLQQIHVLLELPSEALPVVLRAKTKGDVESL